MPEDAKVHEGELLARLDRLPVWPYSYNVLIVVGAGFFFSFFDVVAIGFAMPVFSKQFDVSDEMASWAITSGLIGYIVGSFLDSRISDWYGRRVSLFISVFAFSFGSIMAATSTGLCWLVGWRFIAGMGIGAEIALATTYIGEMSPAPLRGRYSGWAVSAAFLGFATVPFVALALVPNFSWGWRALFVIGGLGGVTIAYMRQHLPDSVHWLVSQGRVDEATELLAKAEELARKRTGQELPPVGPPTDSAAETSTSIAGLLRPPYLGRLILLASAWFFYYVGNYAWLTLTPQLLGDIGYDLSNSIFFMTITGLGFVVGAVAAAVVSDRIERKLAVTLIAVVWGVSLLVIGWFPSEAVIMIFGFVASTTIGLLIPLLYTYTAENFPTRFRATGISLSDGVGHLGGAFCGQITFAIYHFNDFGFPGALTGLAITGFITAVLLLFGVRTNGRSLNHISS